MNLKLKEEKINIRPEFLNVIAIKYDGTQKCLDELIDNKIEFSEDRSHQKLYVRLAIKTKPVELGQWIVKTHSENVLVYSDEFMKENFIEVK